MATQKCPKCNSKRIRLGYRPTPLILKILFRYHLLCDDCNWEFTGFAIPGTVQKKTRKRKSNLDKREELSTENEDLISEILSNNQDNKILKEDISTVNKPILRKNDKSKQKKSQKATESNFLNEETKINDEPLLKKQKVKKRVKVKFY